MLGVKYAPHASRVSYGALQYVQGRRRRGRELQPMGCSNPEAPVLRIEYNRNPASALHPHSHSLPQIFCMTAIAQLERFTSHKFIKLSNHLISSTTSLLKHQKDGQRVRCRRTLRLVTRTYAALDPFHTIFVFSLYHIVSHDADDRLATWSVKWVFRQAAS